MVNQGICIDLTDESFTNNHRNCVLPILLMHACVFCAKRALEFESS
jgi:hypothetical protein